jgi:hypothetical protein
MEFLKEIVDASGNSYFGEWIDKPDGYGVMHYVNGDIYEGLWEEGVKSGYGIMHFVDNKRYEGEWKNDGSCEWISIVE